MSALVHPEQAQRIRDHETRIARELQAMCDDFNRRFPVGTVVILPREAGRSILATVRHPEAVFGSIAMAYFDGRALPLDIDGARATAARVMRET